MNSVRPSDGPAALLMGAGFLAFVAGLRHGAEAGPNDAAMWQGVAQLNLQIAGQLRQKVQAAVDKYGGPENIMEVGG